MSTYMRTHRPALWGTIGAVLFTLALHALLVLTPLQSDEGGYAVVAQHANEHGPYLYGPLFVDRPPLLIELFRVANLLGSHGSRIIATLAAMAIVIASARAAYLIAGTRPAIWAAWLAAAITSSGLLSAQQLNGELLASAFVSCAVTLFLEAQLRTVAGLCGIALGALSGAASLGALLVKQNFADGLAFAGVFVLTTLVMRSQRKVSLWLGYSLGVAATALWTIAWARSHHGVGALLYAMYGIRLDASHALSNNTFGSETRSIGIFLAAGLGSGIILVCIALLLDCRRQLRHVTALRAGFGAAVLVELIGIAAGGNFAPHYLVALAVSLPVITGVLIARAESERPSWARWAGVLVLASALVSAPVFAIAGAVQTDKDKVISDWISRAAGQGDSITVTWTNAQIIRISGLKPAYPYMWALLVRTRDPHLTLFLNTLDGPRPPTWVVRWDTTSDLNLQPSGSVDDALQRRYHLQGQLCGHQVWLLDGHQPRVPLPHTCN